MANPFDDLIPTGAPTQGGAFDDLIPTKPPRSGLSRAAGLGAQGVTDAIADMLGAPVDLTALALRTISQGGQRALQSTVTGQFDAQPTGPAPSAPIGGSQTWRDVFDYVGTAPGRVVDAIGQGDLGPMTEPRSARLTPQGGTERFVYGAGRGAGGAASMFVPAAAVARLAAPNTAGQGIAQSMAAAPGMQTAAGVAGGGVTEVTGDPYAGMGAGFATPVVAALMRRGITPTMQLNNEQQRLAGVMRDHGVPMSPGQASGSKGWRTAESVLGNHPVTAWIAGKDSAAQRAAFNRAVSGMTGDAVDSITPQYLLNTKARIGQGFDEITARNKIDIDDQFRRDVRSVSKSYGDTLDALKKPVFDRLVAQMTGKDKPILDQLIAAIQGETQLTGQQYQQLRSQLGTMADSAMSNDPYYGRALVGLQRSLDDAMNRSVGSEDRSQWQRLRNEYGAYKAIDDTMRASSAGSGDVPPTQLWMQARDRNNPQMRDLARAGQEFVRDTVPNSGTPQRLAMQTLLTGGAAGYGAGALDPLTAALAFGAPIAAQAVMRGAGGRMASSFPTESLVANALAQRLLLDAQGGRLVPR